MKEFIIKHIPATIFTVITVILIPAIMIHYNLFATKPKLKFYLGNYYQLARTDEHVDSLSISYKGADIIKDSMNLALTKIRIANKGSKSIKPEDYTRSLGMIIQNCKIIDVGID